MARCLRMTCKHTRLTSSKAAGLWAGPSAAPQPAASCCRGITLPCRTVFRLSTAPTPTYAGAHYHSAVAGHAHYLQSEAGRKCRPAPAAVLSGAGWALPLLVRAPASAFPTRACTLWRLF